MQVTQALLASPAPPSSAAVPGKSLQGCQYLSWALACCRGEARMLRPSPVAHLSRQFILSCQRCARASERNNSHLGRPQIHRPTGLTCYATTLPQETSTLMINRISCALARAGQQHSPLLLLHICLPNHSADGHDLVLAGPQTLLTQLIPVLQLSAEHDTQEKHPVCKAVSIEQ